MKFNLTSPCKDCPFRKDCLPGWLGRERATEIAADCVIGDFSFACHKTTFGEAPEESQCAGAMIMVEKERGSVVANLFLRLAVRFGHLPYPTEFKGVGLVHDSIAEFIAHHDEKKLS